jgi:hypothetical protein
LGLGLDKDVATLPDGRLVAVAILNARLLLQVLHVVQQPEIFQVIMLLCLLKVGNI